MNHSNHGKFQIQLHALFSQSRQRINTTIGTHFLKLFSFCLKNLCSGYQSVWSHPKCLRWWSFSVGLRHGNPTWENAPNSPWPQVLPWSQIRQNFLNRKTVRKRIHLWQQQQQTMSILSLPVGQRGETRNYKTAVLRQDETKRVHFQCCSIGVSRRLKGFILRAHLHSTSFSYR